MKKRTILAIVLASVAFMLAVVIAAVAINVAASGVFGLISDLCTDWRTDEYVDYVCVDGRLTWEETQKAKIGTKYLELEDSPAVNLTYKKIKGVSPDMMVGAWAARSGLYSVECYGNLVLVNPDSGLDIWNDWTVSSIERFSADYSQVDPESNHEPEDIIKTTTAVSDDGEVFAAFLDYIRNEDEYQNEASVWEPEEKSEISVRVRFEENENIVWETKVRFRHGQNGKEVYLERLIFDSTFPYTKVVDVKIPKDTPLYDFLIEAAQ